MKTNKLIAIVLSVLTVICLFAGCSNSGKETESQTTTETSPQTTEEKKESISVFVTVANGKLEVSNKEVMVNDSDSDGKITINDTLICTHEQFFKDGKNGFDTKETEYGLSVTKLWGVEGYSIGYNLNDKAAMGLTDEVKTTDYVCAYVYTDTQNFSDTYMYFDTKTVKGKENEEIVLTLSSSCFDSSFNPVVAPAEGLKITVDGTQTNFTTDENGKVTLTLTEGEHTISAMSDTIKIVPPVCTASITK